MSDDCGPCDCCSRWSDEETCHHDKKNVAIGIATGIVGGIIICLIIGILPSQLSLSAIATLLMAVLCGSLSYWLNSCIYAIVAMAGTIISVLLAFI